MSGIKWAKYKNNKDWEKQKAVEAQGGRKKEKVACFGLVITGLVAYLSREICQHCSWTPAPSVYRRWMHEWVNLRINECSKNSSSKYFYPQCKQYQSRKCPQLWMWTKCVKAGWDQVGRSLQKTLISDIVVGKMILLDSMSCIVSKWYE